jgi:hypothetical protein
MKTIKAVMIYEALQFFNNKDYEPTSTGAYKIAINKKKLGDIYTEYASAREKLIKNHNGRQFNDSRGRGWEIPDEDTSAKQAYSEELEGLNDVDTGINIDDLLKIKLSELGSTCPVPVMDILSDIIKE